MSEPTAEATIRTASLDDLDAIAAAELASFPAAEAATRESFAARLSTYPDHFWLLEVDGRLASFVNGMTTDEPVLRDEMYDDAALHNEAGAWQMIFGVVTVPEFRRRGYAERLLRHVVEEARAQGRRGPSSPARTTSCTTTPSSASSTRASRTRPTAASRGTR